MTMARSRKKSGMADEEKSSLANEELGANSRKKSGMANQERSSLANEEPDAKRNKTEITLICSQVNMHLKEPWSFTGRIMGKNHVKHWKNLSGSGKLIELLVQDNVGDDIRVLIFNDGVDVFGAGLKSGNIYEFSHGRVKHVSAPYKMGNIPFELSFNEQSTIREVKDAKFYEDKDTVKYDSVSDISNFSSDHEVNIIGMVSEFGTMKSIITTSGKNVKKRDFYLVDMSGKKVLCTVWGQLAEDDFDSYEDQIILIRRAKVNEFRHRKCLNVGIGSVLFHDVQSTYAKQLEPWFNIHKFDDFEEVTCDDSMVDGVDISKFKT